MNATLANPHRDEPRTNLMNPRRTAPSTASLTCRPALRGDLIPLQFFLDAFLRKDVFIRRGMLEELVRGPYHRVWIAEIGCVLVGVAITTHGTRLINVLVHPAYRNLGIGRALIAASGATEVRAKLDMSSGDPRPFYEAVGFARTHEYNEKGNIEILRRPTSAVASKQPAR